MKKLALISAVMFLVAGSVWAGEKDEAVKMVNEAAALAATDRSAAIAEMSSKDGRFVKGEVYVFAYDLTGTMVAHPINQKLVGKNLVEVPDAEGKMFRKEIIEGVKAAGTATVRYKYKNPQTGAVENKVTYCKKAADLAICAGYYE
jgi:signal transduction histidine kinase